MPQNSSIAEVYGEGDIVLYGKPVLVNAGGEYLAVRNWDGYVYAGMKNWTWGELQRIFYTYGDVGAGFEFFVLDGKKYYIWSDNRNGSYQIFANIENESMQLTFGRSDCMEPVVALPETIPLSMFASIIARFHH
ncbi:MAG: hypothetical protein ACP5JR_01905 [Thermoplasmata archaeon]